jgi:hypothetical protein
MKKIFPFLLLVVLMAACQKDPDMSDLNDDFVVYTDCAKDVTWTNYQTYYIPDSVMTINGNTLGQLSIGPAEQILGTFVLNMDERNFTQSTDKASADLGLMVTYVQNTNLVPVNTGSYWWNIPAYNTWWLNYWNGWNGWNGWNSWYSPFQAYYAYQTGSILAQIVDLNGSKSNSKLNVVWEAYITGLLYNDTSLNLDLATKAINQAFKQTPSLKTLATPAE